MRLETISTGLKDFIYGLNQYRQNQKSFYDLVLGTPQWIPKFIEDKSAIIQALEQEKQQIIEVEPEKETSYQPYSSLLEQVQNPLNYLEERLDRFRSAMRQQKGQSKLQALPEDGPEKLAEFECHLFDTKMRLLAQNSPGEIKEWLARLYIGLSYCQTINHQSDTLRQENFYPTVHFNLRQIIKEVINRNSAWENDSEPRIGLNDVTDLFFKKELKMAALLVKLENGTESFLWKEEGQLENIHNTKGEEQGLAVPFHLAIWHGDESAFENQFLKDHIQSLQPQDRLILGNEKVNEDLAKAIRQGIKDAYHAACFPHRFDDEFNGLCLARFTFPGNTPPPSLEGKSIAAAAFILAYIQFSGFGKDSNEVDPQEFAERFAATGGSSEEIAVGGIPRKMQAIKPHLETGQIRYLFAPPDQNTHQEVQKILGLYSGQLKEFRDNDKLAFFIRQAWKHFGDKSLRNTPFLGICSEPMFQDTIDVPFVGRDLEKFENEIVPNKANLIYGVGGIGKTRLLVEHFRNAKQEVRHRYPGGTLWLRGNLLKEDLAGAYQKAYFLPEDTKIDELYEQAKEKLPELKHYLIVIDGFDPPEIEAAEEDNQKQEAIQEVMDQLLEDLLFGLDLSQTTVLISSKSDLSNYPRLSNLLASQSIQSLSEEDALELLQEYAKPKRPEPQNLALKLVKEVDCHSLVLELLGRTLHTTGYKFEELVRHWEKQGLEMREISKEQKRYRTLGTDHQANVAKALNLVIDKEFIDNKKFVQFLLCLTLLYKQGISLEHWRQVSSLDDHLFDEFLEQARGLGLTYYNKGQTYFYTHGLTQLGLEQFWPENPEEKRRMVEERLEKSLSYLEKNYRSRGYVSQEDASHLKKGAARKGFQNLQAQFLCQLVSHYNETVVDFNYSKMLLQTADDLAKEVELKNRSGLEAKILNSWGMFFSNRMETGDLNKAISYHEQALKLGRRLLGNDHFEIAGTLNSLARPLLLRKQPGDLNKAIKYYEQALEIGYKVLGNIHPNNAEFLNNLGMAVGSRQQPGDLDKAIECYEQALEILRKVWTGSHLHIGKTLNNLGMAFGLRQQPGDIDKAIECYGQSLKMYHEIFGDAHAEIAKPLTNLAHALELRQQPGDLDKAVEYHEQALILFREIYGNNHSYIGTTLNNLAHTLAIRQQPGDLDKAIVFHEQALNLIRAASGGNSADMAVALNNLASALEARKNSDDLDKAIEHFEHALKILRNVFGENNPDTAKILGNLASVLESRQKPGDLEDSIKYHEHSLKIYRKIFGDNHPEVARTLNNLAGSLESRKQTGDLDNAIEYYEQALKIYRGIFGDNHPHIAMSLNNLAYTLDARGDFNKSIEYYNQALKILREVLGDNNPMTAQLYKNLAFAHESRKQPGDLDNAIINYEQALNIKLRIFGNKHLDIAWAYKTLAYALASRNQTGDLDKAIENYEQAVNIRREVLGEKHPDVAQFLIHKASALQSRNQNGDLKAAEADLELAIEIMNYAHSPDHPDTKMMIEMLEQIKSQQSP